MDLPGDVSLSRFARVRSAFEDAWAGRPAARHASHYRIADASVGLRIVGNALAAHIQQALTHLRDRRPAAAPYGLRMDLWDVQETGVPGLPPGLRHAVGRRWEQLDGVFAASEDARLASHELGASVTWLDRRTAHLIGWVDDGRSLSPYQRARPLETPLALWAYDRGIHAIHAGAVARDDRAVLIPGKSGSGKSTVAVACLSGGYQFLGDDWIGIDATPDGAFAAIALYASALLDPEHAARFPHLQRYAIPFSGVGRPKSLLLLGPLFPTRLGRSATVRALALPRLVGHAAVGCPRASKAEAWRALAPSSIFTLRPRSGREGLERITELVDRVPAYWLELGDEVSEIPRRMDEILALADAQR